MLFYTHMFPGLFNNVTEKEKDAAVEAIIRHATPRGDFFLMLVLSVAMAAFGILLDSTVILIGSMLVAPLLHPILSFALGIIVGDTKLIGRSVYTILKSAVFALAASFIIGLLFSGQNINTLILSFDFTGHAGLMYAVVATISGFAAAFAVTKPHLNETLPGVAISVSLVPPLATAGVSLSLFEWGVFSNAVLLFIVNIIGIAFSAMIVFALMRFAVKQKVTTEAVKEEDRVIEKEMHAVDKK